MRSTAIERRHELGAALVLGVILLVFYVLNNHFFTGGNVSSIFTYVAELGLLAMAETSLMVLGEIDISVGAVYIVAALAMAELLKRGDPEAVALLAGLAVGLVAGLLNAFVTLGLKMSSLIATLGTYAFWTGVSLLMTGGAPVDLLKSYSVLQWIASKNFFSFSLQICVLWWLILFLVGGFVLGKTRWGNWMYATGANRESARYAGVPTLKVKVVSFVAASVLAAIAGIFDLGLYNSMSPAVSTEELQAIAAAVIGGVSIWGGIGTFSGVAVGTVALASIDAGLVAAGAPTYYYQGLTGVVIIFMVAVNGFLDTSVEKRAKVRKNDADVA